MELWDIIKQSPFRKFNGHSQRVSSLSWNKNILSSAGRDTTILNSDIRSPLEQISTFEGHKQEICGLKWSPDGKQLASGGNDNNVLIWQLNSSNPYLKLTQHKAAVKGLAWCPYTKNLLATGGGTQDKTIKFWKTDSGQLVNNFETDSQVCGLLWNPFEKEILSSHGYSKNQLCLWKYPEKQKITELTGHTSRVLHLALSPEGDTVCSAAADETLRFWKIFQKKEDSNVNNECCLLKDNFMNLR